MAGADTHDTTLVALSVAIAIFASYSALDLAGRVRAADDWEHTACLFTATLAMDGGVWPTHFVAMPAFSMPGMDVHDDVRLTILSILVAIGSTAVALALASGRGAGMRRVTASTAVHRRCRC